jgi:hypothetical protein
VETGNAVGRTGRKKCNGPEALKRPYPAANRIVAAERQVERARKPDWKGAKWQAGSFDPGMEIAERR